jgi:hypothetical protein
VICRSGHEIGGECSRSRHGGASGHDRKTARSPSCQGAPELPQHLRMGAYLNRIRSSGIGFPRFPRL